MRHEEDAETEQPKDIDLEELADIYAEQDQKKPKTKISYDKAR
jgi:hypothetical protein